MPGQTFMSLKCTDKLDSVLCVQDAPERPVCMLFYEIYRQPVKLLKRRRHVITETNPAISGAAAFWTRCSRAIGDFGRPASTALQWSNRLETKAVTR